MGLSNYQIQSSGVYHELISNADPEAGFHFTLHLRNLFPPSFPRTCPDLDSVPRTTPSASDTFQIHDPLTRQCGTRKTVPPSSPTCCWGSDMDAITPNSDEAEKPSHAPYGKACLNCVKSKTRCAGLVAGEKCERFVPRLGIKTI